VDDPGEFVEACFEGGPDAGVRKIPRILLAHDWIISRRYRGGYYVLLPERTPAGRLWYRWVPPPYEV
jgi:hypothetical protein